MDEPWGAAFIASRRARIVAVRDEGCTLTIRGANGRGDPRKLEVGGYLEAGDVVCYSGMTEGRPPPCVSTEED